MLDPISWDNNLISEVQVTLSILSPVPRESFATIRSGTLTRLSLSLSHRRAADGPAVFRRVREKFRDYSNFEVPRLCFLHELTARRYIAESRELN